MIWLGRRPPGRRSPDALHRTRTSKGPGLCPLRTLVRYFTSRRPAVGGYRPSCAFLDEWRTSRGTTTAFVLSSPAACRRRRRRSSVQPALLVALPATSQHWTATGCVKRARWPEVRRVAPSAPKTTLAGRSRRGRRFSCRFCRLPCAEPRRSEPNAPNSPQHDWDSAAGRRPPRHRPPAAAAGILPGSDLHEVHHRVRDIEVGPDVLHVVMFVEQVDQT